MLRSWECLIVLIAMCHLRGSLRGFQPRDSGIPRNRSPQGIARPWKKTDDDIISTWYLHDIYILRACLCTSKVWKREREREGERERETVGSCVHVFMFNTETHKTHPHTHMYVTFSILTIKTHQTLWIIKATHQHVKQPLSAGHIVGNAPQNCQSLQVRPYHIPRAWGDTGVGCLPQLQRMLKS